ncbi:response regulator [Acidovorax sp. Root217]|uniref:response regulator n=1 Tax=Acidovorax sp. Root217 TaxID=1736492 RepID=UPI000A80AB1E|nr:response regulator [Acidovorax sp. Root217]
MNPSILIVDDNPAMIQVMAGMLKGAAQLRFAMRGREALDQMAGSAPDLVLLDAEMPGMSGYEVCAAMKADARLADVPVIFSSPATARRKPRSGAWRPGRSISSPSP